jgi:hypothetical protein
MFRILVGRAERFRMLSQSFTKGLVQTIVKSSGFLHGFDIIALSHSFRKPIMASIVEPSVGPVANNASFSTHTNDLTKESGLLSIWLGGCSNAQIALTILAILIAYDQFMYLWRKGPIAGPAFKIPFMGPFVQALYPKFDAYLAQWASGPLSCVSVFHK